MNERRHWEVMPSSFMSLQPMGSGPDDSVSRTGMPRSEWQRIKALKPRDTQMFVSCAPNKDKHSRATYRKAEHAK